MVVELAEPPVPSDLIILYFEDILDAVVVHVTMFHKNTGLFLRDWSPEFAW